MEKKKGTVPMVLFEMGDVPPSPAPPKEEKKIDRESEAIKKAAPRATAKKLAANLPQKKAKGSGLIPEGDVRLTANIREDLHLRLKISAARQRTTIGELIEELVERYL